MRDAMGGVVNITFIAIFMIVVSGYLAFTVSYNKAFKVKNKAISILEQYEHYNSTSQELIKEYMNKLGYNAQSPKLDSKRDGDTNDWDCKSVNGICVRWTQDTESGEAGIPKGYYSVKAGVYINVPIFNKFLPYMTFFQTQGDTMTINAIN